MGGRERFPSQFARGVRPGKGYVMSGVMRQSEVEPVIRPELSLEARGRLQRSKRLLESEERAEGRALGFEWAATKADAGELATLEEAVRDAGSVDALVDGAAIPGMVVGDDRPGTLFWRSIDPEGQGDRQSILVRTIGRLEPRASLTAGFIEGALDAWAQVE